MTSWAKNLNLNKTTNLQYNLFFSYKYFLFN